MEQSAGSIGGKELSGGSVNRDLADKAQMEVTVKGTIPADNAEVQPEVAEKAVDPLDVNWNIKDMDISANSNLQEATELLLAMTEKDFANVTMADAPPISKFYQIIKHKERQCNKKNLSG